MLVRIFGPWVMRFAPEGDAGGAGGGQGGGQGAGGGDGGQGPGGTPPPGPGAGGGPVPPAGGGQGAGGTPPPPAPEWRSLLPEDIRGEKALADIKDVAGLAKAFVDTKRLVGTTLQLPGKDAKPEDVAKWKEANKEKLAAVGLATAGAPAKASDYTFDPAPLASMPGLPPLNDAVQDYWKAAFHDAGVTPEQAQKLFVAEARRIHQGLRMVDEKNQEAIDGIESTWGTELFTRRWALAQHAIKKIVPTVGLNVEEVEKYLDTTRKGNDPILFQILAAVGEAIDEDTGMDGVPVGIIGPAEAVKKMETIRADKAHPWNNDRHPRHKEAVEEFNNLLKLAYGTGKASAI